MMRHGTRSGRMTARISITTALVLWALVPIAAAGQAADLDPVIAMIESDRLAEAEDTLLRLLADDGRPAVRELLGIVLLRQGRLREARAELEAAIAAAPNRPGPRQHLARIQLMSGDDAAAVATLRQEAALGELQRDLAQRLVTAEIEAGNWRAAEAQLESLVERFDSVRAMLRLAGLRAAAGDATAAERLLRRALDRAPNSEDVLAAYARLSLDNGVPVPAILALEPLVRMHPLQVRYAYLLGVAYLQVGELRSAVATLETVVAREPDDRLAKIALGMALNNQQLFERASVVLREALRLDPESVEALAALAEAEHGASRLESATTYAERVLNRAPEHGLANLVMGMIALETGEWESARDHLQRAVVAIPDSPKAHYQLSLAYARIGDMEQSEAQLERYRAALARMEEQLQELRSRMGLQTGGMQP